MNNEQLQNVWYKARHFIYRRYPEINLDQFEHTPWRKQLDGSWSRASRITKHRILIIFEDKIRILYKSVL